MPDAGNNYENLFASYYHLNRLDEAQSTIDLARTKGLEMSLSPALRYLLAFRRGDTASMAQQVELTEKRPGRNDIMLTVEADVASYSGLQSKARELSRLAIASAENSEQKEAAAAIETSAALRELLFGNPAVARQHVTAAFELSSGSEMEYQAALVLAATGDAPRALALANTLGKKYPEGTIVQFKEVPTVRAQIALANNDPAKAVEDLQTVTPYELGIVDHRDVETMSDLYPIYLRGEAYLALRDGGRAAIEFQKIIDHRNIAPNCIGAFASLGLARAYVLQGDAVKGKVAYQDFFNLWKNADTDIPILQRSKAEYANLQ